MANQCLEGNSLKSISIDENIMLMKDVNGTSNIMLRKDKNIKCEVVVYLRNIEFIMTNIEFIMAWIHLIFLENINENRVIRFYRQDRKVFAASSVVRSYPATRTLKCFWCLANQKKLPPCIKTFEQLEQGL
jgi:hypothetical protein